MAWCPADGKTGTFLTEALSLALISHHSRATAGRMEAHPLSLGETCSQPGVWLLPTLSPSCQTVNLSYSEEGTGT